MTTYNTPPYIPLDDLTSLSLPSRGQKWSRGSTEQRSLVICLASLLSILSCRSSTVSTCRVVSVGSARLVLLSSFDPSTSYSSTAFVVSGRVTVGMVHLPQRYFAKRSLDYVQIRVDEFHTARFVGTFCSLSRAADAGIDASNFGTSAGIRMPPSPVECSSRTPPLPACFLCTISQTRGLCATFLCRSPLC